MNELKCFLPVLYAFLILGGLGLIGGLFGPRQSYLDPFAGSSPMTGPLNFVCKEHNFKKVVSFYDSDNPPTCPTCGKTLTKGKRP